MAKTVNVGEVSAKAGETKWGPATWVEARDSTRVGLPVIIVNGAKDGPKVVLCGATHPTELSGTAVIHDLTSNKLNPAELKRTIIAFPIANPLAMQFVSHVTPRDAAYLDVSYR